MTEGKGYIACVQSYIFAEHCKTFLVKCEKDKFMGNYFRPVALLLGTLIGTAPIELEKDKSWGHTLSPEAVLKSYHSSNSADEQMKGEQTMQETHLESVNRMTEGRAVQYDIAWAQKGQVRGAYSQP